MSESNKMTGGMSSINRAVLIAAFLLLVGAVGYAIWRDSGSGDTASAAPVAAGPTDAIAALEARTKAEPNNAEAWKALGEARFDLEDFPGAVAAYDKAVALSPQSAGLWSALGEARIYASSGDPFPAEALTAFQKSIGLDARDPRARYFLAVKKDVEKDHKGAIDDWFALLADTPQGAPWEENLRRTIEEVGKINNIDVAARGIPGPSRAEMEAASQLPKGQQDAMIEGMVSGLEAKLKANPADIDRWIMLMRSRMTLGETAKASQALKDGIAANPGAAGRLKAQAQMLGVPGA